MTDKLIRCPYCGHKMLQDAFGLMIALSCKNSRCDRAGVWYSLETIKDAQKCAVLQKKLDKAMVSLQLAVDAFRVLEKPELYRAFEKTINEIEDIKEQ